MANKPRGVVTHHLIRNIIFLVVLVALGGTGAWVARSIATRGPAANSVVTPAEPGGDEGGDDGAPAETEDAITTLTIEDARDAVTTYYSMLAAQDFAGLRSRGFDSAAAVIELGWTSQMGLEIHPESLVADVDALPAPVGTWAGNDLYAIGDFFKAAPAADTVKSNITGATGPVGWAYHDALDGRWHIIDPTLPAGTQAPAASAQSRQSVDGLVDAETSSPGVFRNQWWAMTIMTVQVTSRATTYGVRVEPRAFDESVSVTVPDSLLAGIPGSEIPAVPPVNEDGTPAVAQKTISGVCKVWRGDLSSFPAERIGQSLMRIDGHDLSPVSIIANEEDVAPLFPVDNETAATVGRLLNDEQIEQYGLTGTATVAPAAGEQAQGDGVGVTSATGTAGDRSTSVSAERGPTGSQARPQGDGQGR